MANRYWVGGSGTWNSTNTNNWSTTSGGSSGASVPTSADSVFFDRTGSYTVTNTSTVCLCLDFTISAGSPLFTRDIYIYGSISLASTPIFGSNSSLNCYATTTGKTITTGGVSIGSLNFDGVGGAWTLQDALKCTFAGLYHGSLALNNKTFTCTTWYSGGAGATTLNFGTSGTIVLIDDSSMSFQSTTTLTVLGTPVVSFTYSGATTPTFFSSASEANSISFNITAGTYNLSITGQGAVRNLNFTGFAGTWTTTVAAIVYGNLTISSGMTIASSANAVSFKATSGTKTITSNAKTFDLPVTFDGVGGTFQLQDALLMGATRALTHTNGTIDLNGKTLTVGTAYTTATGTKNLTFNAGTLVCPAATTTAFNNAVPTGYTTTAGTGVGKISITAATAKTFVGGGSTFNCTLSNDGAGALTISGSNTFTTIANGVQPTAFTFTAVTTQTVTNWNVNGTAGNLVTIISSTAGVPALLSKASGTVSSNYLSLKDSTATGGATWSAVNSTNVSGNLGWIFTAPPATNTGNFFFMF